MRDIVTDAAIRNAMVVHAAFGGSTNLLLHIPAVAHAAGLARPTVRDWIDVNRTTPRLVSALPNGPIDHPTVRVFLAGGVPEVMLHLRDLGLLDTTRPHGDGRAARRGARRLGERRRAARGFASSCGSATASIPTTSSSRRSAPSKRASAARSHFSRATWRPRARS